MKLCIIAPFGLHEDRGDAIRVKEIFEELSKRSHLLTYVGMRINYHVKSAIHRHNLQFKKIPKIWWPTFSLISVIYSLCLDLIYDFDLFYFVDIMTPFFAEFFLKKIRGKKIVLEMNGIFSEELIRDMGLQRKKHFKKLVYLFEKFTLRNVDICNCTCNWLKNEAVRRGVSSEKIIITPSGVNLKTFNLKLLFL